MNAMLARSAPLTLFARLLGGQLPAAVWARFVQAYDDAVATSEERTAYAAFLDDALRDLGPGAVALPKAEELTDLLACTRA